MEAEVGHVDQDGVPVPIQRIDAGDYVVECDYRVRDARLIQLGPDRGVVVVVDDHDVLLLAVLAKAVDQVVVYHRTGYQAQDPFCHKNYYTLPLLKLEFDTYVLNEKMIPIWKSIAAHVSLVSAYDAGMVG